MHAPFRHRIVLLAAVCAAAIGSAGCGLGELGEQVEQTGRDVKAIDRDTRSTGKLLKKRLNGGHKAIRGLSRDGRRISHDLLAP